jgi:hypothetical protein
VVVRVHSGAFFGFVERFSEAVREQMFSGFAQMRTDDDIVPVRARSID